MWSHAGESLGTLDFVKARVTAATVHQKMSVCMRFVEVPQDTFLGYIQEVAAGGKMITVADKLAVNTEDISGGYEDAERKIKVGDLVRPALGLLFLHA